MIRAVYTVLSDCGGWKIRFNDVNYSYSSQTEAVTAAIDAARKASRKGRAAQVIVQGMDGEWELECSYAADPHLLKAGNGNDPAEKRDRS